MINKLYLQPSEKPIISPNLFPTFPPLSNKKLMLKKLDDIDKRKEKYKPHVEIQNVNPIFNSRNLELTQHVSDLIRDQYASKKVVQDEELEFHEEDRQSEIEIEMSKYSPQAEPVDYTERNDFRRDSIFEEEPIKRPEYQMPNVASNTTPNITLNTSQNTHENSREETEKQEQYTRPVEDDASSIASSRRDAQPAREDERSDLLWTLRKIKSQYVGSDFPEYNFCTSNSELKRILKYVEREINLEENKVNTKRVITMLWHCIEQVCTQYLSIDMSGFAFYESQHMNEYEKIISDMSERPYLTWRQTLSPELQFVVLLLMHSATFVYQKNSNSKTANETKENIGLMRGPKI